MKIKRTLLIAATIALFRAVPASGDVLSLVQTGTDWSIYATRPSGVAAIGGFDIDLAYNPAVLGYGSTDYALNLGDPSLFEAFVNTPTAAGASVSQIAEVSFLSNAVLSGMQSDPVLLATVHFTSIGTGLPGVQITRGDVSDGFGNPITTSEVPEPGSWLLLLTAAGGAATALRRRM